MREGGEQLRDWQERRGFNQRETADYLGLNEVHYSQILNGLRQPGLANAVRIELLTGIPVRSWALSELSDTAEPAAAGTRKRKFSKA